MPTIASNKQPTIAIITAQYCEKLAVDAMLENKETFVRYTTVGKYFIFDFIFYAWLSWSITDVRWTIKIDFVGVNS